MATRYTPPLLRPIVGAANAAVAAPTRALATLGHQATFLSRSVGSMPYTVRRYRPELWRLLSDVSWGNGAIVVGGGTSQSAPIWAGLTAVMNQYLLENGDALIGDINPLLYRIAQGAPRPAFRDVTLGGNAVDNAGPGYDLVTGLGTPDIDNLVRNLQIAQRVGA